MVRRWLGADFALKPLILLAFFYIPNLPNQKKRKKVKSRNEYKNIYLKRKYKL